MKGARDGRILPRVRGMRLRADFGMRKGIWGGTWLGRYMYVEEGVVAEVTEGFC